MAIINTSRLDYLVSQGHLTKEKHNIMNLWIYGISKDNKYWSDEICMCNGLVVNENSFIIARSFKKFFELGYNGVQKLPIENFEVTEKIDGHMIIATRYNRELIVSTGNSFDSDIARKAYKLILRNYPKEVISQGFTYIFELVSPEFRNILDYNLMETLYLITIINNETGKEIPLDKIILNNNYKPVINKFIQKKDIFDLKWLNYKNQEGLVVHFTGDSNLRFNVTFEDYQRIEKLLDNLNMMCVWDILKSNQDISNILNYVNDDIRIWIEKTRNILLNKYFELESSIYDQYNKFKDNKPYDTFYEKYFSYMDNENNLKEIIWITVKPKESDYVDEFYFKKIER